MQFSRNQRELAISALGEAEEHTSRYYCIPPHQWQELRYDLLTRQDFEWEPLPESILARVQKMKKVSPRLRQPTDFYRIQLNDPGILLAAARENLGNSLYHFLVYILTHEMVHMVRLHKIIGEESEEPACTDSEEHRVQEVSRRILSKREDAFRIILERFCNPSILLRA